MGNLRVIIEEKYRQHFPRILWWLIAWHCHCCRRKADWWMMNWESFGRNRSWLNQVTVWRSEVL